jgi:hypothetical protein
MHLGVQKIIFQVTCYMRIFCSVLLVDQERQEIEECGVFVF